MERSWLKRMNSSDIELDSQAMQAWLQSPAMENMLEEFAEQIFKDGYEVKVLSSRAIVTSDRHSDRELLRKVKGKKK